MALAHSLLRATQKYKTFGCNPAYLLQLKFYLSSNAESFLSGANANFLESQYKDWSKSKGSIDSSWDGFYDSVCGPALKIEEMQDESSCSPKQLKKPSQTEKGSSEKIKLNLAVASLIRSYQTRGHLLAKIDPLGMTIPVKFFGNIKNIPFDGFAWENQFVVRELCATLGTEHMDLVFELPPRTYIGGKENQLTLREIIRRLENVYCQSIGVEYMHLYDLDAIQFIRERMEIPGVLEKSPTEKKLILRRLTKAVFFEKFLELKWPASKRFGLEGSESMIVMLEEIIDTSTKLGIQSILMGMPHRGRLNTMANVCRKQLVDVFALFHALEPKELGSGDIKYHMGSYIYRYNRHTNKYIRLSMSPNPSHLEIVNPVVVGKTRAEQFLKGDSTGDMVMAVLIHGDAALCGQGVTFETSTLSKLPAFTAHGCIHIVCNNQIGYTTNPKFSRSSPYCSDFAKAIDAPILHVNCDDADAVAHVGRVAIEFRCKFKKDIVLDLVCYRRLGHNREDEPMYTQPIMYKKIKTIKTVDVIYGEQLKAEGIVNDTDIKNWEIEYRNTLNQHFELSKKLKYSVLEWIDTPWTGFYEAVNPKKIKETGISQRTIATIAAQFSRAPDPWGFEIHKGISRILAKRKEMITEGIADWAMGEALAYGSLLRDKIHVRLTGEDVERGANSHRHHVLHHQGVDGATYRVLDYLYPDQARYDVHNSSLSELGVLGFESGYSCASPWMLTIWEAQLGDFASEAQPIIDHFVASGESKWVCQSGLVMHLPHGLDGGGPEHSSAKIERFLGLSNDDEDIIPDLNDKNMALEQLRAANWIICNVTTPANYFHMIRRQIALPFRKPLVVMTPKVGLKHPYCRSKFSDFLPGTSFKRVIPEDGPASQNPEGVQKLIFCVGSVAIKIDDIRREKKLEDKIAMCRIEQIYPFPYDLILQEFCKYKKAKKIFCQEEHKNQGPLPYCKVRLENLFNEKVQCISRPSSPAAATGLKWLHAQEIKELKEKVVANI